MDWKEIEAIEKTDDSIIVKNVNNIKQLYTLVEAEENFILRLSDGSSELIIANNISSKIKNGDIIIMSRK